jgi:hypothetical protein
MPSQAFTVTNLMASEILKGSLFGCLIQISYVYRLPFLPPSPLRYDGLSTVPSVNGLRRASYFVSKKKLCYDRRPVGQSVLVSSTHLGPKARFLILSDNCGFVVVGRSLWREHWSVV